MSAGAGAKVLGKLARGFQHNIPLQPFTALSTQYPHIKRQSQSALVPLVSLSHLLSNSLSAQPASSSLGRLAAIATTAAALAGVSTVSASALSADERPLVGSYGIGKPQGGGRWATQQPQPNAVSVQQLDAGEVGQAGEDAFFLAANGRAWGVADGVGGWASVEGADSAAYSRTLMQYALDQANRTTASADTTDSAHTSSSSSIPSKLSRAFSSLSSTSSTASTASSTGNSQPLRILDSAYRATAQHNIIGSTTACIVTYDSTAHKLHYANLGDSGFLLVRHNQTAPPVRSKDNQHSFNCPYQLGSQSADRPTDAIVDSHDVYDNDILVLATDGFFDNLHQHEIVAACQQHTTSSSLNALAEQLCREAYAAASDSKRDTPFSRYCRQYGKRHSGGKMDDITVVVVQFKVKPESGEVKVDEKVKSKL